jgi:hypothetical protein
MSAFSQLPENKKGSAVDRVALFCALVSVVCVLGAHALDKLAHAGVATTPGVDYSSTGSIPWGAAPRLDPCGAKASR